MSKIRKQHGSKTKAKIALEAIKNESTLSELGRKYSVHSIQIGKWRKELVERAHELFVDGRRRGESSSNGEEVNELLQTIGRLKVENDFLKKKSGIE
jgi:transposase